MDLAEKIEQQESDNDTNVDYLFEEEDPKKLRHLEEQRKLREQ